jgi:hypothetical protein
MLAVMEDLIYIVAPGPVPQIQEQTAALKFGMASEPLTGALLRTLAASRPGGRLLELGTGTGLALDGAFYAVSGSPVADEISYTLEGDSIHGIGRKNGAVNDSAHKRE